MPKTRYKKYKGRKKLYVDRDMANKGINNEAIREKTNWFQDKNEAWKFESSNKIWEQKIIRLKLKVH